MRSIQSVILAAVMLASIQASAQSSKPEVVSTYTEVPKSCSISKAKKGINYELAIVDGFGFISGLAEAAVGAAVCLGGLETGPGSVITTPAGYYLAAKGTGDAALNGYKLYLTLTGKDGRPYAYSAIGVITGGTARLFGRPEGFVKGSAAAGDFADFIVIAWIIPKPTAGFIRTFIDMKALHSVIGAIKWVVHGVEDVGADIRHEPRKEHD